MAAIAVVSKAAPALHLAVVALSGERLLIMQAAEAKEKAAEEAAAQRAAEAAEAQRRVAEVEREMQGLLAAMERQKRASAAKVSAGSPAVAWQAIMLCM